jgi:hypothetical protein
VNRHTDFVAGILGILLLFILKRFVASAIRRGKKSIGQIFRSMLRPVINARNHRGEIKQMQAARKSQGLPPWENPHI